MKEVPLSSRKYPGLVALVDDEDYEAVNRHTWWPHHTASAREDSFYAYGRPFGREATMLHNFICQLHGLPESPDHANRNGLDDQKGNFRHGATQVQQSANQGVRRSNTSGFKGVNWNKNRGKWEARIRLAGKRIRLGYFDDPVSAGRAYDAAAAKHFGEFAWLNFPGGA